MTRRPQSHALALGGGVWAHADLEPLLVPVGGDADHPAILPHPQNARNGDVDAIAESIRHNGLYRPIYCQTSTGYTLAGNHTYAACQQESEGTLTLMPVVWLDVDDEQAMRIMLADNRAADLGTYDEALLLDALNSLPTFEGTLYDMAEVEALTILLNTESYLNTTEYAEAAAKAAADAARRITIVGVSDEMWEWWRALGDDDFDRLVTLYERDVQ